MKDKIIAWLIIIGIWSLAIGWIGLIISLWFTTHWTVALALTILALENSGFAKSKY